MKKLYLAIIVAAVAFVGCSKKVVEPDTSTFYPSPTTFMNNNGDGSITVRAWGLGPTAKDARIQARKQAVRDVIFKGVNIPGETQLSKPLLTEVNADQKYRAFFEAFFTDNGEWQLFVSAQDDVSKKEKREKTTWQIKESVTARVMRFDLRNYLIEKGILKP